MHLVGLTFIYYSKMHSHSNIKYTDVVETSTQTAGGLMVWTSDFN